MILAAALLALAQPVDHDGAYGWRCHAAVSLGAYQGVLWRGYSLTGPPEAYLMELRTTAGSARERRVHWAISAEPAAPAGRQPRRFPGGRAEAGAFAGGPDFVNIDFSWRTVPVGGVWVHYWGDGRYVGVEQLLTARQARRSFDRRQQVGGVGAGLANPRLLTGLADSRTWAVAAVDSTGSTLFTDAFEVPTVREAEAEYRRARAAIDRLEARFRTTHEALSEGGAQCGDEDDPAASI